MNPCDKLDLDFRLRRVSGFSAASFGWIRTSNNLRLTRERIKQVSSLETALTSSSSLDVTDLASLEQSMESLGLGIDVVVSCLASFFLPEFRSTSGDHRRQETLRDVRRRQAQSIGLVGGPLTSTARLHEKLPSLPR